MLEGVELLFGQTLMLREGVIKGQLQGIHPILLIKQQLYLDLSRVNLQIYPHSLFLRFELP